MELERLWQEKHRGSLHAAESWASCSDISLTYAGTGSGFHGQEQMRQFTSLYPAERHALHPSQLGRFDNKLEAVAVYCDPGKSLVIEECILSVFHHEPLDWLAPGVLPCKRQIDFPLTFIATYEGCLLKRVRVLWDQALVLKQMSAFVKCVLAKGVEAEEAFSALPILSGKQACSRLRTPCTANSHPIGGEATKPAPKKNVLDGIKSLLTDLPDAPITPARHRKLPALESSVFKDSFGGSDNGQQPKVHASQASKIVFDDSVETVRPVGIKLVDRIFTADDKEPLSALTAESIKLDPKRQESHVFDEKVPFVPSVALDPKRLESRVFSDAGPVEAATLGRRGLDSRVFEATAEGQALAQPCARSEYIKSHISLGAQEGEPAALRVLHNPQDRNCASQLDNNLTSRETELEKPRSVQDHNAGHFHGASLVPDSNSNASVSVATKPTQNFVFKSSICFAEVDEPATAQVKKNELNKSQVCFDESAPPPPPKLSLKVTNPPGGKSQITF